MILRVMPAISEGSPPSRCWSARAKPVPAFRLVGSAWLLRIDHEAIPLVRQKIHPGAGGEIVRRLGAAVKHDDKGTRSSISAARDEQLVGPASRRVGEGGSDEPGAVRCDIRLGRWSAADRTWQAESGKILHAAEWRGAFAPFGQTWPAWTGCSPSPRRHWPSARVSAARASRARHAQHRLLSLRGRHRRAAFAAGVQWPRPVGRHA